MKFTNAMATTTTTTY